MGREQTGLAGEFWFFSQLHRLGYKAYITLGNTKGVDIALQLNNDELLTFEVKSKMNFSGSFQYLQNISQVLNHFVVFVNLNTSKDKKGITKISIEPYCYILKTEDLDKVAFNWESPSGAKGYGFEAKLLWYLKFQDDKSITKKNIDNFLSCHKLTKGIDFQHYNKIIWTLEDFENNYFSLK